MFGSGESPHLAIAGDTLWISEPDESQVFAVNVNSGEVVEELTELERPGGAQLDKPVGITVGQDGRLWLVDSRAAAVVIFDPN